MTSPSFGTSYFGNRDVQSVTNDLSRFRKEGFGAILHTFSERDLQYYVGTMEDIVEASHDKGFEVYMNPWGVGRVFGGEALSEFIGRHPDSQQILSNGRHVPAACFNDPIFRRFVHTWIKTVATIGPDVVFWDEPHWFLPEFDSQYSDSARACFCETCQEKFIYETGEDMTDASEEQLSRFRERSILDFLKDMTTHVSAEGMANAVCVLPDWDLDHGLRDWEKIAVNTDVDILATDPYWTFVDEEPIAFVERHSQRIVNIAEQHGLTSQIWLQAFDLDDSEATLQTIRQATTTVVDCDVDSVFIWGWDGSRVISDISCTDPQEVWNTYLRSFS